MKNFQGGKIHPDKKKPEVFDFFPQWKPFCWFINGFMTWGSMFVRFFSRGTVLGGRISFFFRFDGWFPSPISPFFLGRGNQVLELPRKNREGNF